MALSPAQVKLADEALARVRAASAQVEQAIATESSFITWLGQGESGRAARLGERDQLRKAVEVMEKARPTVDDAAGLAKYLKTAEVANISDIIADSQRMSASGLFGEVLGPILPKLGDGLGLAARAGGAYVGYQLLGKSLHPLLAAALGWLAGGLVAQKLNPFDSAAAAAEAKLHR